MVLAFISSGDESDEARDARLWLAIAQSESGAWREVLSYMKSWLSGRTPQARAGYLALLG